MSRRRRVFVFADRSTEPKESPEKKRKYEELSIQSEEVVKDMIGSRMVEFDTIDLISGINGYLNAMTFEKYGKRHKLHIKTGTPQFRIVSPKRFRENRAENLLIPHYIFSEKIVAVRPGYSGKKLGSNEEVKYNTCRDIQIVFENGFCIEKANPFITPPILYGERQVTVPYSHYSYIKYVKVVKWSSKCFKLFDVEFLFQ
jgi:hypothetical protein